MERGSTPGRPFAFQRGLSRAQSAIYLVVAALLLVAAGFTLVGTVVDGLIAAVRRILVLVAEVEGDETDISDFLLELGGLSGLIVVLVLSIYLPRHEPKPEAGGR